MNTQLNDNEKSFWRQLVRVVQINREAGRAYVVVPGWNVRYVLPLKEADVPAEIWALFEPGKRLHAAVNIGAITAAHLQMRDWEPE